MKWPNTEEMIEDVAKVLVIPFLALVICACIKYLVS